MPELDEKFRLVRPGNSTFPKAMAIPNNNVPIYSAGTQSMDRITIPIVSKSSELNKTLPIPNRLVNNGANMDIVPKAISGKVVNNPNNRFESPVSIRILSTSGPKLAKAGLRLNAIMTMPTSKKMDCFLFSDFEELKDMFQSFFIFGML